MSDTRSTDDDKRVSGMSLRDWFAGQCLTVVYADAPEEASFGAIARRAYSVADSMMHVRDGGEVDE